MAKKPTYEELEQRVKEVEKEARKRKQAEEDLRKSQEYARNIIDSSLDMIIAVDADRNIVELNRAAEEAFGYRREEVVGTSVDILYADPQEGLAVYKKTVEQGQCVQEIFNRRKNGKVFPSLLSASLLRDAHGEVAGVMGVSREITESKRAEEALRESEEKYRILFNSLNDPVTVFQITSEGMAGKYMEVNDVSCQKLAYTREELSKLSILDIEDPEKRDGLLVRREKLLTDKHVLFETKLVTKDGRKIPVEVNAHLFDLQGKPTVLAIARDIEERKRAEQALKEKTRDLGERVKELNCLYDISKLRETPSISLEDIPQEIVGLIPPSWRYPEITCARAIVEGQEFTTDNFKDTIWKQTSDIIVYGEPVGVLEVCYLEERPESDEGPFLREERNLLNAIAERFGKIIEHRRAGEMLRESEERFRALTENTSDWIWEVDQSGIYTYASPKVKDLLGYEPEEVIGKTLFDLMPADEAERVGGLFRDIVDSREPFRGLENTNLHKDGRHVVLETSGVPILDAAGNLIGYRGMDRDISERKKTEERIRLFSNAVAGAIDAIAITDMKGIITYANPSMEETYGYEKGELLGKPVSALHPDTGMVKEMMATMIKTGSWSGETLQQKRNKETFPALLSLSIVRDEKGDPIATMGAVRDITDRVQAQEALKESEEQIRLTVENAPLGIGTVYLDGRFRTMNQAYCDMLGYSSEELSNMTFDDISHPDDREKSHKAFQGLLDRKVARLEFEKRYIHKDGSVVDVIQRGGIVYDSSGNPLFIIGISEDVTEKKKLEAQLQETKKMEAIATLAGGIAHEFNNTLVGITGNIELLQINLPEDENIDKYAQRMKASALRMAQLTDQLLAYARGGKYQPKNISISDFVEETLALIKQTIAPSIRIETDLPHDISNVEADLTQMQMVLSAVLNNASEAIEDRGRIRIITKNEEIDEEFVKTNPDIKPGPYVSFTVEDDGKGMEEETRSRIFDPFFTTKFQGRGLGMAAVYGIVINHGGWISVDSELGKGTVVRIYLPAVKVQVKEVERPKIEPAKGTGTILLIEDEDVVIDVICAMVERLGYSILLAETGREAVNIAKGFDADIDLAILDILLPDLAAKEVYRDIMEARPNLKVIVCSGYAIDGPPQEILDAGAQDFIQKPFSYATLSEKLKEVLEGK